MNKNSLDPKQVGQRIKSIRQRLGLSMEDFAKRIDDKARSGTVSNWETGKNLPNNSRLKRISEIGEISLDELLCGFHFSNYVDEIMNQEIKQFNSEKYKLLYDPKFKKELISTLNNRYNLEGLSESGAKQYIKELLDSHLDKEYTRKRYTPYSNRNAVRYIYDRLTVMENQEIETYFAKKNVDTRLTFSPLKENEIKDELSYELYKQVKEIFHDLRIKLNEDMLDN